jgi:hypothetical protein
MIEEDDDTHIQLVQWYLEYFRLNESFMQSPTEMKRRTARKALKKIAILAKIRQKEIIQIHYDKLDGRKNNNPEKARAVKAKK